MDQQNNTAVLNDSAGVLPMDTDAIVNGVHDEGENNPSSNNVKKGRGRPAKSTGIQKPTKDTNGVKRGRGRPSKTGETSATKKVVPTAPPPKTEEASANGDTSVRKRGRPSKGDTPNQQVNGISKPQVQENPVVVPEEQDDTPVFEKRKRGRPSGSELKTPVKAVKPSISKEAVVGRKRGRPSGTSGAKKVANKSKTSAKINGSAKKRGRPKKSAGTSSSVAAALSTSETASVASNNA